MIAVDADGLLAGDSAAKDDAIATLQDELAPYATCQVGFVQTFGYSTDPGEGISIANAVNMLLQEAFPDIFANSVVDGFANVERARGHVEIELYFYRGCVQLKTATPTVQASASPVGSPVALNPATVHPSLQPTIGPAD